ncbi:MAG TPA: hypothetical protein VGW75_12670 [Solirubrobacteraceae bacterium]|jgi:hypothetical protein|nr:hypothetical protein [Solirubrobacteraceae bacterium]
MLNVPARGRSLCAILALAAVLALGAAGPSMAQAPPPAANAEVPLPTPASGSFYTAFDYTTDDRIIAFDGFTVYEQQDAASDAMTPVGSIPEEYRGATDPSFVSVSPTDDLVLLGAGAGGSKYPDPDYNGNIFRMDLNTGAASLVGRYPWNILGDFISQHHFVFGQGETYGFFTGSVEVLDLRTGATRSIVKEIPGDPGGVAFDRGDDGHGNLFVGLGSAQDSDRNGEVRRFSKNAVKAALDGGPALDFDTQSTLVTEILNAGDLAFGAHGQMFVGGGDFGEPDLGYVAKVDPKTGQTLSRFDPADGDADDGDFRYWALSDAPGGCVLGALDLSSFFSPDPDVVYQRDLC